MWNKYICFIARGQELGTHKLDATYGFLNYQQQPSSDLSRGTPSHKCNLKNTIKKFSFLFNTKVSQ